MVDIIGPGELKLVQGMHKTLTKMSVPQRCKGDDKVEH